MCIIIVIFMSIFIFMIIHFFVFSFTIIFIFIFTFTLICIFIITFYSTSFSTPSMSSTISSALVSQKEADGALPSISSLLSSVYVLLVLTCTMSVG